MRSEDYSQQDDVGDDEELDLRRILRNTVVGILLLIAAMMLITFAFETQILALGKEFVDSLGPLGVGLGWFLPDALTLPIPADAINMLAMSGDMNPWVIIACSGVGSVLGGCVGFAIGRFVGNRAWFRRFMDKQGREIDRLMRRYGTRALMIAVLTPVPYSVACWGSGALNMRFETFFLISLLRIPRIAFYLLLIAPMAPSPIM